MMPHSAYRGMIILCVVLFAEKSGVSSQQMARVMLRLNVIDNGNETATAIPNSITSIPDLSENTTGTQETVPLSEISVEPETCDEVNEAYVTFNATVVGQTASSTQRCSQAHKRPKSTRLCMRNSQWGNIHHTDCDQSNAVALSSINVTASPENEVASTLYTVSRSTNLSEDDMEMAITKLRNIAGKESEIQSETTDVLLSTARNLLVAVSKNQPIDGQRLEYSSLRNATTNILLRQNVSAIDEGYVTKGDLLSAKVMAIPENASAGIQFGESDNDQQLSSSIETVSLNIPGSVIQTSQFQPGAKVVIQIFSDPMMFPVDEEVSIEGPIVSVVIGDSSGPYEISDLTDPIRIEFKLPNMTKDSSTLACVYYDYSTKQWVENERDPIINDQTAICEWSHLTETAISSIPSNDSAATTEEANTSTQVLSPSSDTKSPTQAFYTHLETSTAHTLSNQTDSTWAMLNSGSGMDADTTAPQSTETTIDIFNSMDTQSELYTTNGIPTMESTEMSLLAETSSEIGSQSTLPPSTVTTAQVINSSAVKSERNTTGDILTESSENQTSASTAATTSAETDGGDISTAPGANGMDMTATGITTNDIHQVTSDVPELTTDILEGSSSSSFVTNISTTAMVTAHAQETNTSMSGPNLVSTAFEQQNGTDNVMTTTTTEHQTSTNLQTIIFETTSEHDINTTGILTSHDIASTTDSLNATNSVRDIAITDPAITYNGSSDRSPTISTVVFPTTTAPTSTESQTSSSPSVDSTVSSQSSESTTPTGLPLVTSSKYAPTDENGTVSSTQVSTKVPTMPTISTVVFSTPAAATSTESQTSSSPSVNSTIGSQPSQSTSLSQASTIASTAASVTSNTTYTESSDSESLSMATQIGMENTAAETSEPSNVVNITQTTVVTELTTMPSTTSTAISTQSVQPDISPTQPLQSSSESSTGASTSQLTQATESITHTISNETMSTSSSTNDTLGGVDNTTETILITSAAAGPTQEGSTETTTVQAPSSIALTTNSTRAGMDVSSPQSPSKIFSLNASCPEIVETATTAGNLTFTRVASGKLSPSEENCLQTSGSTVRSPKGVRYCSRDGKWGELLYRNCSLTATETLSSLQIEPSTSEEETLLLLNILAHDSTLTSKDIVAYSGLLEEAANSSGKVEADVTDVFADNANKAIYMLETISNVRDKIDGLRTLGKTIARFVLKQDVTEKPYEVSKDRFKIEILPVPSTTDRGLTFNTSLLSVRIPKNALDIQGGGGDSKVAFITYTDDALFPAAKNPSNQILSVVIGDSNGAADISNLVGDSMQIDIDMQIFSKSQRERYQQDNKPLILNGECVFYDYSTKSWSTDGGVSESSLSDCVRCNWSHATSFSVFVTPVFETQKPEIVSLIGSAVSMIVLLIVVIVYLTFWRLRQDPIDVITLNISLTMCAAFLIHFCSVVLWGILPRTHCLVLSTIQHFFLLSSYIWMGVMAFAAYKCLFDPKKWIMWIALADERFTVKLIWKFCIVAYGLTIIIWGVTSAIWMSLYESITTEVDGITIVSGYAYSEANFCFVKDWALVSGLGIPSALVLLLSILVQIAIIRARFRRDSKLEASFHGYYTQYSIAIELAERSVIIPVIMSMPWLIQFIRVSVDDFTPNMYNVLDVTFGSLAIICSIVMAMLLTLRPRHVRQILGKVGVRGLSLSEGSYYLDHEGHNHTYERGPAQDSVPTITLPLGTTVQATSQPRPSIRTGIREDLPGTGLKVKRWRASDSVAQTDYVLTGGKLGLKGFRQTENYSLATFRDSGNVTIERNQFEEITLVQEEDGQVDSATISSSSANSSPALKSETKNDSDLGEPTCAKICKVRKEQSRSKLSTFNSYEEDHKQREHVEQEEKRQEYAQSDGRSSNEDEATTREFNVGDINSSSSSSLSERMNPAARDSSDDSSSENEGNGSCLE